MRERLASEYGVAPGAAWELGGKWHPAPGSTPEVVHAVAVEVKEERAAPRRLTWVRLADAVTSRDALRDGHLRVVALRSAHALGVIA